MAAALLLTVARLRREGRADVVEGLHEKVDGSECRCVRRWWAARAKGSKSAELVLNLDATACLALVSKMCCVATHGGVDVPARYRAQVSDPHRTLGTLQVLHDFLRFAGEVRMTTLVALEVGSIVSTMAGPAERRRWRQLAAAVTVVPCTRISARVAALKASRKVTRRGRAVFGAGDTMRAFTVTSNLKFVRGAAAQGVHLDVLEHGIVSLCENAIPCS